MKSIFRIAIATALLFAMQPTTFAQLTCPGSDAIVLDCNGNGTDDYCDIGAFQASPDANTNGIPDECDIQVCEGIWSGFEPAPPFSAGNFLHGIDFNGDGDAWDNAGNTWTIGNQGCPASQGKAVKGVSQTPPTTDSVESEYFRTENGRLDCGAAIWSLTFDARSEAQLNPRIDWQMMLRDGTNLGAVILIHWASTSSSFPGVTAAQGGNGRGRILVQNPAGNPAFINTGFVLAANTCYRLEVVLDNVHGDVELYINGVLRVTATRLQSVAARMDDFRVQQVANGQGSGGVNRLALDNFTLCRTGPALDWPDCNANCISDAQDLAAGTSLDCDSNATPDECELAADCNTNGAQDFCDIANGISQDCDFNGVPNECDPDCNTNGIADGCDLAAGTSDDCNGNGRLDACDPKPDFDDDGLIHVEDWAAFVAELGGPEAPAACPFFDQDSDGDVDLSDAAALQSLYTGPDTDGDRIPDLYETDDGVYLSPTDTGTDPADFDTDRDGLSDGDETYGTLAGLDLSALGASPLRRDIFVEVDWTDDAFDIGPHSHRPTADIVTAIAEAFADAPVNNPYDAPDGVSLHVDYGQGLPFTGGNLIPGSPPFIVFGGQFSALRAANYANNRRGYFHYAIFTHRYNSSTNGSSGVAELPGNDFMVTLGGWLDSSAIANTMMHELGHNLNLHHGGDEPLNQKPNYNSVMNYRYQFGLDGNCDGGGDFGGIGYSLGLLATLDESHLNECNGTCGPGFPVNWNFSGGACETDIAWNITEGEDGDDILSILHDHDDWSSISFATLRDDGRAEPEVIFCQDVSP